MSLRPLAAVVALLPLVSGCSQAASAPQYAEGHVEIVNNTPTLGNRPLPTALTGVTETIRKYEGLDIGVAYAKQEAEFVSPVNDEWRAFADVVDVPKDIDPRIRPNWISETTGPRKTFSNAGLLTELSNAYRSVDSSYQTFDAKDEVSRQSSLRQLIGSYKELEDAAVDSAQATTDSSQHQLLIDIAAESQRNVRMVMANYPDTSSHSAEFLQKVLANQGGAAAIYHNEDVIGTAFVISNSWMITSRHVIAGWNLSDRTVTVRFSAEPGAPMIRALTCTIAEARIAEPASPLDVAAVRPACPGGVTALAARPKLQFATREAGYDEELYVVGYRGKPAREVFMPVYVRFPFRIEEIRKQVLRQAESSDSARTLFDLFYRQCDDAKDYCYRSSLDRWGGGGGTANIPTMGFDSNTGSGNSGSPVFSGVDHLVVGVFFAGAKDPNVRAPYSFERHEAAIPSPLVRTWLLNQKVLQ